MKEAIQKAIEGGYIYTKEYNQKTIDWLADNMLKHQHQVLLDPKFWQALGKSLGWELVDHKVHALAYSLGKELPNQKWLYNWHLFIDHLAEGKDPEEFFTNLLK
jgi:hypothetical protein